ncbi:FMN-binding negative transcriptional regulator [Novosphingobium sp. JCM 18896]|uniref:FMN-binding negative transcriptional regulator n=1 Tax=Novosphingobium sp. JCM 18896 TaxID=2989731 RepID=UPI00222392AD|nr:FMN-binding negative transcriptional regulator [Novosphingobium sp. JCM 18896]MCW1427736.1 FMN-binding negative transcriptional regulator [Novosphingobium sp. JCM 18896]
MHPNAAFRTEDRALMEALIDEIGFGMVFATTPDGPRVAHTPLVWTEDGAIQFHLARGNALTRHLDGTTALAVINGPEGYVSPRWYADAEQVPTWNYVALELEGRVRRMDVDGLLGLLETLSAREEARVTEGKPWTLAKMPESKLRPMLGAIVGFELEIQAWRPTFKLSQNKPAEERERVATGLEAQGSRAIAQLMRTLAS